MGLMSLIRGKRPSNMPITNEGNNKTKATDIMRIMVFVPKLTKTSVRLRAARTLIFVFVN